VTSILFEASICYGHGTEEGSGKAAGFVGSGERDSDDAGARVLRAAERGIECREIRSASGKHVSKVLQEQFGTSVDHAGNVLPAAAGGLLREPRFRARHSVAGSGFAERPQVSGLRSERADTGSFDRIADPAAVLAGDASGGDAVGAGDFAQAQAGEWSERVYRRHYLAGKRVDEESGAARHTGQTYEDYLRQLAQAEGNEQPTKEQLARLDRKRKKKACNDDWTNPNDPSARITKMKDGRTKLAHKAEHAVDLASGAVLAVTLQPADRGDTTSYAETLDAAQREAQKTHPAGIEEVVMDKGYHSSAVLEELANREIRSYVPEPDRGRRRWSGKEPEQRCVYANRRRVRAERSKRLQKLRGELCERSFAHCYQTGGMRQLYLRGSSNALKRLLVHAAAFNLGLLLRKLSGWGKPRQAQGRLHRLLALFFPVFAVDSLCRTIGYWFVRFPPPPSIEPDSCARSNSVFKTWVSATGC